MPDAELRLDAHGSPVTLSAVVGDGTSVLVFYRGAWCPDRNIALGRGQQALLLFLAQCGHRPRPATPQTPDGSLSMQQKNALAFTVVSDPGNAIAGRLGILTRPSDDARAAQLELGLDLAAVNADGTSTLPMPATVILGPGRTVRWIDVHPDYTTRTCSPGRSSTHSTGCEADPRRGQAAAEGGARSVTGQRRPSYPGVGVGAVRQPRIPPLAAENQPEQQ